MLRTYSNREEPTLSKFFFGLEIESSMAYGKQTLFVVGVQPLEEIEQFAKALNVEHVYLGANNPSRRLEQTSRFGSSPINCKSLRTREQASSNSAASMTIS
jgi:hypothetical protein